MSSLDAVDAAQSTVGRTYLWDLFPEDALHTAIANGLVRLQRHPEHPLGILNYTEACAYNEAWNEVTLACRGLIYRIDTREVVARGYPKFFNHGQRGAARIPLQAQVHVSDKVDGSLGILYPLPSGGWAVSTRGSFASEQALHATRVWNERYAARVTPPEWMTLLFEIVYPANRIVVDYGGLDDLVLLGAVEHRTGESLPADAAVFGWPGPVAEEFAYRTFAEALAMPSRENREGIVVTRVDTSDKVKIKYEDYVRLHRLVTGLNARLVWQHLVDGRPLAELVAPLPDEFHSWCRQIAEAITRGVAAELERLDAVYAGLVGQMPAGWDPTDRAGRKDFAIHAAAHPDGWAMFALLDGRDIRPELLKRARPEANVTPSGRTYEEDTA